MLPHDPKAELWPGTGRTLYSMGQKQTRLALERIAKEIGVVDHGSGTAQPFAGEAVSAEAQTGGQGTWLKKLFGGKQAAQSGPQQQMMPSGKPGGLPER